MGYAVVHMQKINKGGTYGIQFHCQREGESKTNPDIDLTRTHLNYDLINEQPIKYTAVINEKIRNNATDTTKVRKDAVVMCNFVITSDEQTMKAMTPEQLRQFFQDSVEFFGNRYGKENLVMGSVHMDETTPHMHLGLVPIKDKKLSCKNIFNRNELRSLQTDFAEEVGKKYGLKRGIPGSERTHLSEAAFKLKCENESMELLQAALNSQYRKLDEVSKQITQNENRMKEQHEKIKELEAQISSQKDFFVQMVQNTSEVKKMSQNQNLELDRAKREYQDKSEELKKLNQVIQVKEKYHDEIHSIITQNKNRIEEQQEKIKELEAQISSKNEKLTQAVQETYRIKKAAENQNMELERAKKEYHALAEQIEEKKKRIQELKKISPEEIQMMKIQMLDKEMEQVRAKVKQAEDNLLKEKLSQTPDIKQYITELEKKAKDNQRVADYSCDILLEVLDKLPGQQLEQFVQQLPEKSQEFVYQLVSMSRKR